MYWNFASESSHLAWLSASIQKMFIDFLPTNFFFRSFLKVMIFGCCDDIFPFFLIAIISIHAMIKITIFCKMFYFIFVNPLTFMPSPGRQVCTSWPETFSFLHWRKGKSKISAGNYFHFSIVNYSILYCSFIFYIRILGTLAEKVSKIATKKIKQKKEIHFSQVSSSALHASCLESSDPFNNLQTHLILK